MNSRIIIKNLPPFLKESELKKNFEEYGEITDIRILFRNKKNRRFAYIGFKLNNSAKKAISERNNTFIGTYKINVEEAKLKNNNNNNLNKDDKKDNEAKEKEIKMIKYKKFLEEMKIDPEKIILNENEKNTDKNEEEIENKNIKTEVNLNVDYRRLYITNLPFNTNKEEIRTIFEAFGEVTECKFPIDFNTGKAKGYAFISYEDENSAIKAFHKLDNQIVLGRIIHLKPSFSSKKEGFNKIKINEKSSYKKLKKSKLLENLRDQTSWNTLFINPNLIIDRVSEKLGIEKRDLLDNEYDDLPIKVSLAETEVINETKDWLKKIGINMSIFDEERKNCQRSYNTIIVKNLNYDITKKKLDILFNKYGNVKKLDLADNKAIAIVQYDSDEHCKNVFSNLQDYETYGTKLMLEYAPLNFYLDKKTDILDKKEVNILNELEEEINGNTLYVKNLNFKTEEKNLEDLINKNELYPKSINIIKKNNLSQGFGFIEFMSEKEAKECLIKLQNIILDNHSLKLSISKKKEISNIPEFSKNLEKSKKLLIKNIPFETTSQELRNLVKNYCDIKSLRLPKKMDGTLRGFCFVEFLSEEDAVLVFENLSKIHFYGRKLNIEFSNE